MADDMPIDLTFLIFLAEWVFEILNSLQNGTKRSRRRYDRGQRIE
jgi:hypothetical protein